MINILTTPIILGQAKVHHKYAVTITLNYTLHWLKGLKSPALLKISRIHADNKFFRDIYPSEWFANCLVLFHTYSKSLDQECKPSLVSYLQEKMKMYSILTTVDRR